jgi:lyso-ornithine lipid O-acyltransferase
LNARTRPNAPWRGLRLAEHFLTGVVLGAAVSVLGLLRVPRPWLPGLVAWWHRRLLRAVGVVVEHAGTPVPGALLVVNHVSWLDIPVLGGLAPVRFLSKAEVRQWPVIGWLAVLAGTLFMQRGAHQASATAELIAAELQAGATVAIFPEATTGDGRALKRFHARLLAAADGGRIPVQPVAIRYGRAAEPDAVAPFIGDDSLLPHLGRVLRHPSLSVRVSFLPRIDAAGCSRRALAEVARAAIERQVSAWSEAARTGTAAQAAARTV